MQKHKVRPHVTLSVFGVVLVASVSACGSQGGAIGNATAQQSTPSASTSARPTLTASKVQPPSQDNDYAKASGKPKVVFDPCTWIPDEPFAKLGLDPSTRERGNDIVAEYTFLTCHVRNSDEALQLDSGNVTLDEVRQKYPGRTQDIVINGRNAVLTPNKTATNDCSVDIRTTAGYFGVTVIVSTPGEVKGMKPCDDIVHIAETLEPYIGKDN